MTALQATGAAVIAPLAGSARQELLPKGWNVKSPEVQESEWEGGADSASFALSLWASATFAQKHLLSIVSWNRLGGDVATNVATWPIPGEVHVVGFHRSLSWASWYQIRDCIASPEPRWGWFNRMGASLPGTGASNRIPAHGFRTGSKKEDQVPAKSMLHWPLVPSLRPDQSRACK